MPPIYCREITTYLYAVAQDEPMRPVPRDELFQNIQHTWSDDSYRSDFTASILYLIGRDLIKEEAAHYRLTSSGMDYTLNLLNPPPDYERISVEKQEESNSLSKFAIGLTIVSLFVAIIGLPYFVAQTHPGGVGLPWSSRASSSIPLSVSIAQTGFSVNTSPLNNWFDNTPLNPSFDEVEFLLSAESDVVETESQGSSNPLLIYIPVQQKNIAEIHLLINLSYASPKFTGGTDVTGLDIARVWIVSGEDKRYWVLKAGVDIREWVVGSTTAVTTVGNHVNPIWQAHHHTSGANAVIDHIALTVPDDFKNKNINYILVEDRSTELLNSKNPGIMIFGITVEGK